MRSGVLPFVYHQRLQVFSGDLNGSLGVNSRKRARIGTHENLVRTYAPGIFYFLERSSRKDPRRGEE